MKKLDIYTEDVELTKLAVQQVGDGKLPNRFFLSFSNGIYNKDTGLCEYDHYLQDGKEISFVHKAFDTIEDAMEYQEDILLGLNGHESVQSIYIEDRLTGLLYERCIEFKLKLVWKETSIRY